VERITSALVLVKRVMAIRNVTCATLSSADQLGSMHPISVPSLVQTAIKVFVARARNALLGPVAPTQIVSTVGTASRMQARNVRFRAHLGRQWSAQTIWAAGLTQLVMPRRRDHMVRDLSQ
jgi:hypothetical protein